VTAGGRRCAPVRYYVDADLLGLAKILVTVRSDVTYPGDPGGVIHRRLRLPCPIDDPATPDRDWLPKVAAQNWLIITRDRRIQDHTAEIAAVGAQRPRRLNRSRAPARTKFGPLGIVVWRWGDQE
jgi:hypothetical protein